MAKTRYSEEKDFHFNVFVHQKWTPYLMMLSLYNSLSGIERVLRRRHLPAQGKVEMNGGAQGISLSNMQTPER